MGGKILTEETEVPEKKNMCQWHFDIPSPKRKSLGLKPGLRDVRSATTALVFMYEYSTKV
jgi:hypothetical protein